MALQGVVALVRGGNGGRGQLICREPAREGAEVAGERVPADSPQKNPLDGDDCEGTAVAVCRGETGRSRPSSSTPGSSCAGGRRPSRRVPRPGPAGRPGTSQCLVAARPIEAPNASTGAPPERETTERRAPKPSGRLRCGRRAHLSIRVA
jgi:hypothetical protein